MDYTLKSFVVLICLLVGFVLALPAEPKPCSSPACKQAADYIIDSMNASANPCDSFYEYACGGWKKKHIPEWRSTLSTFDILNDKMVAGIRELLDRFNIVNDGKTSASSVAYGAYVYQQCLAAGKQTKEDGLAALKEVIKSILVEQNWEIGTKFETKPTKAHSWTEHFVKANIAGVMSVFGFAFNLPDPKNASVNMLTVAPAQYGLGFQEMQNLTANSKLVTAYKDYIRKSAKLFCGDKCNSTLLETDIDDIVNFESELAKNQLSVEKQRLPENLLKVFTLNELKEKFKLDWLNQIIVPIEKALGISKFEVSESSRTIVTDVDYMVKAVEILEKASPRLLANYFGLRIVSTYGQYSSEQLRQIEFEFNQVKSGVKILEERKETCYKLANGYTSFALSRLFVDHFFSDAQKKEAIELVNTIQDSYRALLNQNTWLDSETKKVSLNKLNHVTKNVAYPEWILQNDQLDEFHSLQNKTEAQNLLANQNYIVSLAKFMQLQMKKLYVELNKPLTVDKNWPFPPAIINAAYFPVQNSITIPAGFLKSPFFEAQRPFSLNYGSSGMAIAHEFTHGLDDQGRQFDEVGNLRNWWSAESIEQFTNRSQCFVQQYGSLVDKASGLHVNGKLGLGENIADNGGLKVSYNAFQARQAKSGPSPTLADLPKLTSEQLYFISYANNFCVLYRPEWAKHLVMYDAHAPPEHRVNTPLKNSPDFAKAFKCPAGSPMNPDKKCSVW